MIKTAVFPGSFNPVHVGHLMLANYLCEFAGIDEVWMMVSPQNPLKEKGASLDASARFEMLQLALEGNSRVKASDFELRLPTPTYTVATLAALREAYPGRSFSLLIGADNWEVFHRWKDADSIVEQFPVWIYPRKNFEVAVPSGLPLVRLLDSPVVDVSSTFVRQAVAEGKDMRYFVPQRVWKYISEHHLYR
jgi:nicotinate-nucleotide adenylyltransferase